MPRKAASAPVFDISKFREPAHHITRSIDWGDEGQAPLSVTLQDLSIRQTNELAAAVASETPMGEVYKLIAPYVTGWDFQAENLDTGEMVAVPPPAEAGPAVFELLPNAVGMTIYLWLKSPWLMKAADSKKVSTPSTSTTDPPSNND
jgi:hypothetical protein